MLTLSALKIALRRRRPSPGLIHHTDRGSQSAAYAYQKRLEEALARSSMSRKGDCYDNAPMESLFSTLNRERVHRRRYWTRDEGKEDFGDYIDGFYNLTRRHLELEGVSPIQYKTMAKITEPRVRKNGARPMCTRRGGVFSGNRFGTADGHSGRNRLRDLEWDARTLTLGPMMSLI